MPGKSVQKYDFDKILPDLLEAYIHSPKGMTAVLKEHKGPEWSWFWRCLKKDPERWRMWEEAQRAKAYLLQEQFDDIISKADKAFEDKTYNPNALKIKLEAVKAYQGQMEARFRDREVKHTVEPGEGWRALATEARERLKDKSKIEARAIEGEYVECPE